MLDIIYDLIDKIDCDKKKKNIHLQKRKNILVSNYNTNFDKKYVSDKRYTKFSIVFDKSFQLNYFQTYKTTLYYSTIPI